MQFNNRFYSPSVATSNLFLAEEKEQFDRETEKDMFEDTGLDVREIGMSVPFGIAAQNVQGVAAKVRMGASYIDLQFSGVGIQGSNQNQQKPELYGIDQRQALKELKEANELTYSTHATFGVMGLMGQTQRGFDLSKARQDRDEIKKAIDFLADVGGGGSVTIHTGEFERPVTDIYPQMDPNSGVVGHWYDKNGKPVRNYAVDPQTGRLMFKKHDRELTDASYILLDERNGQRMEVAWNQLQAMPLWNKNKGQGYWGYSSENPKKKIWINPNDYIDYEGRKIEDPYSIKFITAKNPNKEAYTGGRVPEYDAKSGRFKVRMMSLKDFEDEASDYNRYYGQIMGREPNAYERETGRERFAKSRPIEQAGIARGWALQYGERIKDRFEALKELTKAREFFKELKGKMPKEQQWKLLRDNTTLHQLTGFIAPVKSQDVIEYIDEQIDNNRKSIEFEQQTSSSYEMQAMNQIEGIKYIVTPEKYWDKHISREYAIAGLHALDRTTNPKDPLSVTIEHIFPEQFGGHPEELRTIVQRSRAKMVEFLINPNVRDTGFIGDPNRRTGEGPYDLARFQNATINPYYRPGMSRQEAEKLASAHIRATLDTGHINMWRKYWQDDPRLSAEQNQKSFDNWIIKQVEMLQKNDILGHVHLSDNFGYADEHLAPGQGNAPVKEMIRSIKHLGYNKKIVVEPGGDAVTDNADFYGLMKTWRYFGSTTGTHMLPYGGHMPGQRFGEIQNAYFGRPQSPYFIFGEYAPSTDWTLWSATPLE